VPPEVNATEPGGFGSASLRARLPLARLDSLWRRLVSPQSLCSTVRLAFHADVIQQVIVEMLYPF
jgi:hypothetical protein